jgi:cation transport protein ChaC
MTHVIAYVMFDRIVPKLRLRTFKDLETPTIKTGQQPRPSSIIAAMTTSHGSSHRVTRDALRQGVLHAAFKSVDPAVELLTDAAHRLSVRETLRIRPDGGGDVWLFTYGSLMWNPMVDFIEKRVATISGYHRRFCLWTHLYRGSPADPGLVLGLVPGGSCRGVVYRIAASAARTELELVWRREMINGGYHPTWLRTVTPGGRGWAIGFVTDRRFTDYAGFLPEEQVAQIVARARGYAGSCAAYLFDTVHHLDSLGIRDAALWKVRDRVKQLIESKAKNGA